MPKSIDKLVEAVEQAYDELHPKKLSNVWMSLHMWWMRYSKQKVQIITMFHTTKKKLEDNSILPEQVEAPKWHY